MVIIKSMKKHGFVYILLFFSIFLFACNKKMQNDITVSPINEIKKFNEKIDIYISGYYGVRGSKYEYGIKMIENKYILTVTVKSIKNIYEKILSVDEICDIFNFIMEHEIENIVPETQGYAYDTFEGSIIININDKIFENVIKSNQEKRNNLYTILNFLNNYIGDKEYCMPIMGVK
jgi:hypothetical protein